MKLLIIFIVWLLARMDLFPLFIFQSSRFIDEYKKHCHRGPKVMSNIKIIFFIYY